MFKHLSFLIVLLYRLGCLFLEDFTGNSRFCLIICIRSIFFGSLLVISGFICVHYWFFSHCILLKIWFMGLMIRESLSIILCQMKHILLISLSLLMKVIEIDSFNQWYFIWTSVKHQRSSQRANISVDKQNTVCIINPFCKVSHDSLCSESFYLKL